MEETEVKKQVEGAEVGGKYFPFKPLTVTQSKRILKKLLMPNIFIRLKNIIARKGANKRWWKRVRNTAFVRTGWWHLGIVPKELRCSNIKDSKATEIEESFFAFAEETVKEYNRLSILSNPSLMAKSRKSVSD